MTLLIDKVEEAGKLRARTIRRVWESPEDQKSLIRKPLAELIMSAEQSGHDEPSAHFLALGDPTKEVAWASGFGYHLGIDSDQPLVEDDNPNDKKLIRKMARKKSK
ncbi:hypothetical protein FPHYL_11159 [Fusarium phyllophilum]|uniref:Uncharacterized protein n=1 Tax=Fusarium phyllophilum TaxID=47803 RepID=A0A8H5MVH0_9HYPO|nr:hypothetical protein FPHYL_11159 [Fusarium phyllophilum]